MWQFAKKLLGRFPVVAAKRSWQIFAGIAVIVGFLDVVNKSLQQQVLNTPNWSFILLGCAVLVYTVFATAYEESRDRTGSEKAEVEDEIAEVANTSADAARESAIAYKYGQDTIEGLRDDLNEANGKLTQCMEKNAALREEIARLKSPDNG